MENPRSQVPVVIREIYDNEKATDIFEFELDKALESRCDIIVIEPSGLAHETANWIMVGNCLHRTAVLSGVCSVAICVFAKGEESRLVFVPFTAVSVLCTGLYMICWQFDPCCKYQVTRNTDILLEDHKALLLSLTSTSPTILIKKDDTAKKIVHSVVTLVALIFTVYRFCK